MAGSNFDRFPAACRALAGKHGPTLRISWTCHILSKTACDGFMVVIAQIDPGAVHHPLARNLMIPVLSLPKRSPYFLHYGAGLVNPAFGIFLDEVEAALRCCCARTGSAADGHRLPKRFRRRELLSEDATERAPVRPPPISPARSPPGRAAFDTDSTAANDPERVDPAPEFEFDQTVSC
jgi:hypothetical protein